MTRDGLGGADRLGEGASRLNTLGGHHRNQGLEGASVGLIEPATRLRPEPHTEGNARLMFEIGNGLEPHAFEPRHQFAGKPQSGEGQIADRLADPTFGDSVAAAPVAGHRMSRAIRRRDGGTAGQANGGQPRDQVFDQGLFAAFEMGGSRHIDGQAVRAVSGANRRIAVHRPQGEAVQRPGVAVRIGIVWDQSGNQGMGLGDRHPRPQAELQRGRVAGGQDSAAAVPADQDQRLVRRRRVGAQASSEPVGGPLG